MSPLPKLCILIPAICLIPAIVHYGFGHHVAALDPATIPTLMHWAGIGSSPLILSVELSKSSFALTLVKLFRGSRVRWFLWFSITTTCVFLTVNFIVMYVRCTPVKRNWDMTVEGKCWSDDVVTAYSMFAAGYSALMDFVLALLPWKLVMTLQMKRREKMGVALAMSMGVL
jgi:hypothetical protein